MNKGSILYAFKKGKKERRKEGKKEKKRKEKKEKELYTEKTVVLNLACMVL